MFRIIFLLTPICMVTGFLKEYNITKLNCSACTLYNESNTKIFTENDYIYFLVQEYLLYYSVMVLSMFYKIE